MSMQQNGQEDQCIQQEYSALRVSHGSLCDILKLVPEAQDDQDIASGSIGIGGSGV